MSKAIAAKITTKSARRLALAALDVVLMSIAVAVAGNKSKGEKLLRSVKRGANRSAAHVAFFTVAASVWEAREVLLSSMA